MTQESLVKEKWDWQHASKSENPFVLYGVSAHKGPSTVICMGGIVMPIHTNTLTCIMGSMGGQNMQDPLL